MRLARHQQHAELVAYAIDGDHRAVIDRRQLAFERRGFDLDNVRTFMLDVDIDAGGLPALQRALADGLAIAAHGNLGALAGDALVVQPIGNGLRLADNAEPGRGRYRD